MRVDVPCALVQPLVTRKSLAEASVLNPGPSVVRFGAAGYLPNRSRARVALCAVASSGLGPSRVSQIGCDLNQPCRRGCFLLCPEGDELEACPRGPEAVVGCGD